MKRTATAIIIAAILTTGSTPAIAGSVTTQESVVVITDGYREGFNLRKRICNWFPWLC